MASAKKECGLDSLLEAYISEQPSFKEAFRPLLLAIKQAVAEDRREKAARAVRQATLPTLDYTSAQSLFRLRKILREANVCSPGTTRLAVVGGFTTKQLSQFVDLFLFSAGVDADIYEADYGTFRQEILDPGSQLYSFEPQTIFIATSWRDLAHWPDFQEDQAGLRKLVAAELADWAGLWQTAYDRLGCQIIQNNFDLPAWRTLANHEMRHPGSRGAFIAKVNDAFGEQAPPYVTIHDVEHLSACWGKWAWGDERFYHHAKIPCDPACLVDYGHSVASIVAAHLGLAKKCLVLDLDNTLWGGVIGDDGLGGIRLGQGDPESEAFLAFQQYIKTMQLRGIILAVCSKNEETIAREAFEKHPDMVLRLDDIACFVANWADKATNLQSIAKKLNIGLDSLVFVDDNPAERAMVRRFAPEVAVPELPDDPAGFIRAVERYRYFQAVSLRDEDLKRTDYYRKDLQRAELESSAQGVDDFLKSLQMVARIAPISPATLDRSAQLINKTNQFNLTTRRRTAAEVKAIVESDNWITRTVSLADRFGDNGLISVLLAEVNDDALMIDTWLMSCRVFKRGVEYMLMDHLCKLADEMGLSCIRGRYIPTARNVIVKELYAELGFKEYGRKEDGELSWELALADWKSPEHFIEENTVHG